ncbi:MarR family transcriptional regulator [Pluralibacter gergoviae]
MITNIEFNVLNVMSSKEGHWTWRTLDITLHSKNIPGFSHVFEIVNKLAEEGLVHIEDGGHPTMKFYRVSEKGYQLLKESNKD